MSDILDPTQGLPPDEVPTSTPPVEETPPAPAPTAETPPEWRGRLDKANNVNNALIQQLESAGYIVDRDTGQIVGGSPTQPQPQPEPMEEDDDEEIPDPSYDPAGFKKWLSKRDAAIAQTTAQAISQQFMPMFAPVAESAFTQRVVSMVPDIGDLQADTIAILKDMGYTDPQYQANVNPKLVKIAVEAARGRRATAAPPPAQDPKALQEAARQAALLSVASVGGPGGAALPESVELDDEQRDAGKRLGLDENATKHLVNNPASINIGGGK